MATAPDPLQYQTRVNKRIRDAISELIDQASEDAAAHWAGRRVRFNHRWHQIDPTPTVIETHINNAYLETDDDGGDWQLKFEFIVRDPRTGRDTTITRGPHGIEFI